MHDSDNQYIQHLCGLLSIYFAPRWQGILPMRVVKDEVHQDQAGSLVPKWFSGAQAPTIQCNALIKAGA